MSFLQKIKNYGHLFFAMLAYWYYGRPARQLIVVGVTGTKGKTTTCRLIASVLEAAGNKVGLLSTVEFQIGDTHIPNTRKMTMLGHGQIQSLLRDMVDASCTHVVIETSSQGILQYRHYGLHYDVVVFTNLAPEHVEAHGGFDNLKRDKGRMFAGLRKGYRKTVGDKTIPKIIVANADDTNAPYYLNFTADQKYAYNTLPESSPLPGVTIIQAQAIHSTASGSAFQVGGDKFELTLQGTFNVSNALAAVTVGKALGIPAEKIREGLKAVTTVTGRMEPVNLGQPFHVIVDYAHDPLSLEAVLTNVRKLLLTGNQRLIAVVGSDGGGRDQGKRATTGALAARLSDIVIVTTTDPYDEDPAAIVDMVAAGAIAAGFNKDKNLFTIPDRRAAITKAISLAQAGDAVILTAKGHETVMAVANGQKIPWNDKKVASELLAKYKNGASVV